MSKHSIQLALRAGVRAAEEWLDGASSPTFWARQAAAAAIVQFLRTRAELGAKNGENLPFEWMSEAAAAVEREAARP